MTPYTRTRVGSHQLLVDVLPLLINISPPSFHRVKQHEQAAYYKIVSRPTVDHVGGHRLRHCIADPTSQNRRFHVAEQISAVTRGCTRIIQAPNSHGDWDVRELRAKHIICIAHGRYRCVAMATVHNDPPLAFGDRTNATSEAVTNLDGIQIRAKSIGDALNQPIRTDARPDTDANVAKRIFPAQSRQLVCAITWTTPPYLRPPGAGELGHDFSTKTPHRRNNNSNNGTDLASANGSRKTVAECRRTPSQF